MNYNFVFKLTSLQHIQVYAKNCAPIDLRAMLRNCKYLEFAVYLGYYLGKLDAVRDFREAGWFLRKYDSSLLGILFDSGKKFSDVDALLNYCESKPRVFEGKLEPSVVVSSSHLNKLSESFRKLFNWG